MGKCKGCGKLGRMVSKDGFVSAYHSALLLCPIVSVWDCAVRKMRKVKKKQVKDELDRQKQAEKKKRRLEKALATSAAIISELEKKKQKKKEEQQRLDEEGAAIAEAVALHVLLGEDSDDSRKMALKKDEGFNPWDCATSIDLLMGGRSGIPCQGPTKCSLNEIEWVSNVYESGCEWNYLGNGDWSVSSGPFRRDLHPPYFEEGSWETTEISAGLLAAQAVSSLQIAEDAPVDTIVFNGMLRGYTHRSSASVQH
ncbi:hypothetical protein VitviT2T_025135 [Vitis vinifera]|uniref:Uncharacterized protein n=1 Tax=Vitis vinifera TaxID=29760 RepID=A0ABY9DKQ4_VITVI|nr:hypothetical protein VitviT2T_025135 [Vitis vinifera]